jgi:acetyl esterase/lipase
MENLSAESLTFTYKVVDGLSLYIDVYPPTSESAPTEETKSVPAVVYFHPGGLFVGYRKNWVPTWLQKRLNNAGIAFIAVDHRLLGKSTGHDVLEDIKDLFAFLNAGINPALDTHKASFRIDPETLASAGGSAGGLCACLSAIHALPRPKAVLSMYAMGGNLLTDFYLEPKTKPFLMGRPLVDPTPFGKYIYPQSKELPIIAESPLAFHPSTSATPGLPANPRMALAVLFLQQATWLDYYTGDHTLSERLRSASSRESVLSEHVSKELFPQFQITNSFPPTLLVHGTDDTGVLLEESRHLQSLLEKAGVKSTLTEVEGKEHLFDHVPDADTAYGQEGGLFDKVAAFLIRELNGESS